MAKKILFLGAAYAQIPIIIEAKSRGWHVATCDYLPSNPGHKLADEYHNVSTTDYQGVLELAEKIKPNFVVAYASDPAAPVAAYVSEQLGLPGNPYKSVLTLAEKDLFRNFLRENGFNTPKSVSITGDSEIIEKTDSLEFPVFVKPTDSSGSKGVSRVDNKNFLKQSVAEAFRYSRNKRIIAEEFIDNEAADIHGDGFVTDGKLVFTLLGDHIYNEKSSQHNPVGTLWPSAQPENLISRIQEEAAGIIEKCGYQNGPVNIEARVNHNGEVYIMEIGPRSGGHFVPQAIKYACGFDMVKATLDILCNKRIIPICNNYFYTAYYAIHSNTNGTLRNIYICEELRPYIKEFHQYLFINDRVKTFNISSSAIGIILLAFDSMQKMTTYINNIEKYVSLEISDT